MFTASYPPADDLLAVAASVADRLARVDWRARSRAGVTAVLTAVAVIHCLALRLAPYAARALRWLADQLDTLPVPPATLRPVPAGTVVELRALARSRGIRTIAGRPVKYANRAQLLAAMT